MKIILCDLNYILISEWEMAVEEFLDGVPGVNIEIHHGDFRDKSADCLVSPANSFSIMDGGVDEAIIGLTGPGIQEDINSAGRHRYGKAYIPIGCAVTVPIKPGDKPFKRLISAPTMSIPGNVSGSANAYISTRAAVDEALDHHAESVLLFGMGALTGGIDPRSCARQMLAAIRHSFTGIDFMPTWEEVARECGL